jgi:hypothetical protein
MWYNYSIKPIRYRTVQAMILLRSLQPKELPMNLTIGIRPRKAFKKLCVVAVVADSKVLRYRAISPEVHEYSHSYQIVVESVTAHIMTCEVVPQAYKPFSRRHNTSFLHLTLLSKKNKNRLQHAGVSFSGGLQTEHVSVETGNHLFFDYNVICSVRRSTPGTIIAKSALMTLYDLTLAARPNARFCIIMRAGEMSIKR